METHGDGRLALKDAVKRPGSCRTAKGVLVKGAGGVGKYDGGGGAL